VYVVASAKNRSILGAAKDRISRLDALGLKRVIFFVHEAENKRSSVLSTRAALVPRLICVAAKNILIVAFYHD